MLLRRRSSWISLALVLVAFFYLLSYLRVIFSTPYYGVSPSEGPLFDTTIFRPGIPKPANETYSRTLVMARLEDEDISWIAQELPDLNTAIYVVDRPDSGLPANKGHEAMAYLTYIIDHYDNLPDVALFFHPHKVAWHNNILLDVDTATTIKRLSSAHVIRQGYMNSRCHLDPGCPHWLHVDRSSWRYDLQRRPEEPALTSEVFHALHPDAPAIPPAISQPCCAQFAVSRDRILSRPRSTYVHYRDWLLNTTLDDQTSGRLMEYSWQYIFTGNFEFCPAQHVCYCDGYGICFGGESPLRDWLRVLRQKELVDEKLVALWNQGKADSDRYRRLATESERYAAELDRRRTEAIAHGDDPRNRAAECGREWNDGDGF